MKNPGVINSILLFIAVLWGFGFVPQREGMAEIGPYAFNTLRFFLGALTLLPVLLWQSQKPAETAKSPSSLKLGLLLGLLLFLGATMQQQAIAYTSLGNVAFITGLYVIVVPMLGFFLGYRYKLIVWLGGLAAIIGLYLMTGGGTELSLKGDLLALSGAGFWAVHLLILARSDEQINQIKLAVVQFSCCAFLSLLMVLLLNKPLLPSTLVSYLWIAISGVLVVGVAFTLQVVVMPRAEPFLAAVIMSLEAVFGALAGYLMYQEKMTLLAMAGAVLMLLGCLLTQLPQAQKKAST